MSEIKEHWNSTLLAMEGKLGRDLRVGDMVRNFYSHKDVGLVVERIDENNCKVLWGKYVDPWVGYVGGGGGGTLNYNQIAHEMVPIQTMELPQGLMFYLDQFGEKKDE